MTTPRTPLWKEPVVCCDVGRFGFTATLPKEASGSEITLVAIASDRSDSTSDAHMVRMLERLVTICAESDLADTLLMRLSAFGNRPEEIHGFYPVNCIDSECYEAALMVGGTTALYDAAVDAISTTSHFATVLAHRGYDVNGVVAIITDGVDDTSVFSPEQVKETLEEAAESEDLASLMSILVGVDLSDAEQSQALNKFQVVSGFRHRIDVADTSERAFLDLADRLSEVVLLQRRSVGTKSPES